MALEGRTYSSDINGLILLDKFALRNTGTLVCLTHPNYFRTPKRIYPSSKVLNLTKRLNSPVMSFLSNTKSIKEFDNVIINLKRIL